MTVPKSKLLPGLVSVAAVAARAGANRFRVQRVADSGSVGVVARIDGARFFTAAQADMVVEMIRLTDLGYSTPRAAALLQARASGQLSIGQMQIDGRRALEDAERAMAQVFIYARLLMDARAESSDGDTKP